MTKRRMHRLSEEEMDHMEIMEKVSQKRDEKHRREVEKTNRKLRQYSDNIDVFDEED